MVKKEKASLEKSFAALEKITDELQSGDFDLEKSLSKFEEGLVLSEQLKSRLSEIENKMEKIKIKFSNTLKED